MSDEGRLFLKDDADKTKACFYCGEPESHGVDHCMGVLRRLRAQLAALQATADRYRGALEEINRKPGGWVGDWSKDIARRALADTSPPAQPACTRCGDAREVYFDDAGALARGYMRPCPDCAAQPVALREAREVARLFHDAYERLAPSYGWTTNAATAVEWDKLPTANRELMVHVVSVVLSEIGYYRIRSLLSSPRGAR